MVRENVADVTGDLALHGVTKPITLTMTYNGGYEGHIYEPRARIGFSAKGKFKRSDFGMTFNKVLDAGGLAIADEVLLRLDVSLQKAAASAAA